MTEDEKFLNSFNNTQPPAESDVLTPYAVYCHTCSELVFMTEQFYHAQMMAPDNRWVCPRCFNTASWSDDNYESYYAP
jgi:ribosomal protein S27AE